MNAKSLLSVLGIGMAAGAALTMTIKPREQAMLRKKAGQAMKTVGGAMENIAQNINTF
jgi:gas vesicle protein